MAGQWVPESNGSVTPEPVTAGSRFRAAWRCGEGCEHCGTPHEWSARVKDRTHLGTSCPLCSGLKPCRCRSMAALHPELMKQWDWEGNQGTDPYSIGSYSHKKQSWICTEHGQWKAAPHQRVYAGAGCPQCAKLHKRGPRPQRGFLKDELPGAYAELHPTKNAGVQIENLTCGSHKKVWWLCQAITAGLRVASMSMHGRRKFTTAAGQGVLQDAPFVQAILSAHASLLQDCSRPSCSTGTLLIMPFRCKSPWIHPRWANTATERTGGATSVLMGRCTIGTLKFWTWSKTLN